MLQHAFNVVQYRFFSFLLKQVLDMSVLLNISKTSDKDNCIYIFVLLKL